MRCFIFHLISLLRRQLPLEGKPRGVQFFRGQAEGVQFFRGEAEGYTNLLPSPWGRCERPDFSLPSPWAGVCDPPFLAFPLGGRWTRQRTDEGPRRINNFLQFNKVRWNRAFRAMTLIRIAGCVPATITMPTMRTILILRATITTTMLTIRMPSVPRFTRLQKTICKIFPYSVMQSISKQFSVMR